MEIISRFGPRSDIHTVGAWASDKALCKDLLCKVRCWNRWSLRSLQPSNHIYAGFVPIIPLIYPNCDRAEVPTWIGLHVTVWAPLANARRNVISMVTSKRADPLGTDNCPQTPAAQCLECGWGIMAKNILSQRKNISDIHWGL